MPSSLPDLCHVITVDGRELPPGHTFIIVKHEGRVVICAQPDDRAQLEARAAFFAWDRLRDAPPMQSRQMT